MKLRPPSHTRGCLQLTSQRAFVMEWPVPTMQLLNCHDALPFDSLVTRTYFWLQGFGEKAELSDIACQVAMRKSSKRGSLLCTKGCKQFRIWKSRFDISRVKPTSVRAVDLFRDWCFRDTDPKTQRVTSGMHSKIIPEQILARHCTRAEDLRLSV